MVEGRAGEGFEAAVKRGGTAFGADIVKAFESGSYDGVGGLSFDFEHKPGTHGAVNVTGNAYAAFLRDVSAAVPPGLSINLNAATGWSFEDDFANLLAKGLGGGNVTTLLDMGLYHGSNATQWAQTLDNALTNAGPAAAHRFGAGLSLAKGKSQWEATPQSVFDRFAALKERGVRSVGVFHVSHGGLSPVGLAPAMVAAWTRALHDFANA
jgi:hypothetical protein